VACTDAPPAPPGAQYFADARKNLTASDFDAALKNLDRAIKASGDQPIGQEAIVLRAVLLTALAESDKQMAEAYSAGLKEPAGRARFGNFNKMRGDYYGGARARLIGALQAVMDQRGKLGDGLLPLEVEFPVFTGAEDPAVTKIKQGYAVEDADRNRAEAMGDRNALARILAALAGVGEDPHKGQEIFSKGKVDIDPRVYLVELSNDSLRLGAIFAPRALDERDHLRAVNEVTRDNLNLALKLLTAKPDKDLEARARKMREDCERTLKILGP
jgi:hypothetical protein